MHFQTCHNPTVKTVRLHSTPTQARDSDIQDLAVAGELLTWSRGN